jgi:hypothetical protein
MARIPFFLNDTAQLQVLIEVDDAIRASGHQPRLPGMEGDRVHRSAAHSPVPAQHFQRHQHGVARQVAETEQTKRKTRKVNRTVQANATIVSEKTEKMT